MSKGIDADQLERLERVYQGFSRVLWCPQCGAIDAVDFSRGSLRVLEWECLKEEADECWRERLRD